MFTFSQTRQLEDETIDVIQTRLQQMARNCWFTDKEMEVKPQLTISYTSTELEERY